MVKESSPLELTHPQEVSALVAVTPGVLAPSAVASSSRYRQTFRTLAAGTAVAINRPECRWRGCRKDSSSSLTRSAVSRQFLASLRNAAESTGSCSFDRHRFAKLNSMTSRARLDDVPALATEVLAGKTRGRVVIDL
jgi:hypothetical protein